MNINSIMYNSNFLIWYMNKLLIDNTQISLCDKQFEDNTIQEYLRGLFLKNSLQNKLVLLNEYNKKFNSMKA